MTRAKKALAIALVAGIAGIGFGAWRAATAGSNTPSQAAPKGNYSVEQARSFSHFPLYNAGESVDGYPLVAVLHEPRQDTVDFIYGDCVVPLGSEGGCSPPVEVQVWPACFRNPSLYKSRFSPPFEKTTVRGVPAEVFEGGTRMELHTGKATVVIFAASQAKVMDVARALRGVNVSVPALAPLPAPAAGVMSGELPCTA